MKREFKVCDTLEDGDTSERVPISKKGIEGEGWKYEWYEKGVHSYSKGDLVLSTFDDTDRIKINYATGYQLFDGMCPFINDFKYICKLISI